MRGEREERVYGLFAAGAEEGNKVKFLNLLQQAAWQRTAH
jgi:hypothetical protein